MRTRSALPILLTSASIMISGISLSIGERASAQEAPQVRPPVTIPRPRVTPPTAPPGEAGGGTKIAPFVTGLEETEVRPTPPGARVSFNLEDADLPDLVRLISRITGKRFILPSKARSIKATIYSPADVTAAEAYQAFLSILTLNGMALEPAGRYLKIVESGAIESKVLPLITGGEGTPADDRYVTRMVRVENVGAEDVATLLARFKTEAGSVTAYAPTNTLIITDTGASIRRMLRILAEIDIPRTGEQIWIEPVHYAPAAEIAETLQQIFPTAEAGAGGGAAAGGAVKAPTPRRTGRAAVTRTDAAGEASPTIGARTGESRVTSIIPEERSNQLIIVATERAYLRILEVLRVLDQPVEGEGGVHIYRLQYADAELMAEVLSGLISGGGGGGAGGAGEGKAPRRAAAEAAGGAVAGFSGAEVAITSHKDTNSLLITATAQDYASLRRVIDRLDVVPRQVFIEAVVMELSVTRTTKLGLNYHGGLPVPDVDVGNGVSGQGLSVLGFGAASSIGFPASALAGDTLTGLALGVRGPAFTVPGVGISVPSFGVVLNALATSADVDVLATPHLIAMDNTEAEINVGANIPLQTSGIPFGGGAGGLGALGGLAGAQGGAAGLAGLAGLAGGMGGMAGGSRQSVGTIIRITPHINDAGEIRMEIEEEISEAGEALPGNLGAIPIQQRIAKTQVLVRDQQTVVIGGLMRDRVSTSETKIPILGDIPILGALFRTTSRQTQKTNLLLFLTPYVIRTPDDLRAIFERKMRERQEFIDRYFVFGDHDYSPPLDYSRTRGLLGEIFLELDALDEERTLIEELRSRPPPEHVPRAPLGEAEGLDSAEGGDLVIEPEGDTVMPEAQISAPDSDSVGSVEVTPPQQ
ncbi:MAG: type II secretion system secretin GspD [Myxococcota bacterium]|nr:type II secretion system secretin GspD [Myxococcota bacterium]